MSRERPSRRHLLVVLGVLAVAVVVPPPFVTPTAAVVLRLVWVSFVVALVVGRRDAQVLGRLAVYAGGVWVVTAVSGGALALAA